MEQPAHEPQPAEDAAVRRALPVRAMMGLVHWATASKLRLGLSGIGLLSILAVLFGLWSYAAHLAIDSLKPATLEMALAALDAGDLEQARGVIGDMQEQVATPRLIGGAMFVLGAVKAAEGDLEASGERRAATYQIAARYLVQAREQGVPKGREAQSAYLLGKCLAHSGQPSAAIPPLREALDLQAEPAVQIHALLVRALLESPHPDLQAALAHNEQVIADASLTGQQRDEAWLLRADTLVRLGRGAEALAALAEVTQDGEYAARRTLLVGRLEMDAASRLAADAPERTAKLDGALEQFANAQRLDVENGQLARQAMYWSARCYELKGDLPSARTNYARLSNLYGDTDEGIAATMVEADFARAAGDRAKALEGYRSVLQAVDDPHSYDNTLLPLPELQGRLWTAYNDFLKGGNYADSLTLLALFEPVLGRAECMELRAKTHQEWGARRRDAAREADHKEAEGLVREGRFHLRAAGRAYEDLARIRYALRFFTRDLWDAADCYFQGQSYSNAARLFEEYLLHEAQQRNDIAMVRLGQSRLAMGDFDGAIQSLEECIETFTDTVITHQARLEAARAYRELGKLERAEALLRSNLEAPALTPQSPEWRESLFALGHLLYELEQYEGAVDALQEAVARYPQDDDALLAKYTIARAYHSGAEALAQRLREPNAENEAQLNRSRKQIAENLDNAYATYLDVQQTITLEGNASEDLLTRVLQRNCYMMQGSVLLELRRFNEARQAYQNVITLYQDDPVVLEGFVQVANCWRRLDQPELARGNLERARDVLNQLPESADFLASTNFNRQQWQLLLEEMLKW